MFPGYQADMKKLLVYSLIAFLTGVCFSAGLYLANYVREAAFGGIDRNYIDHPAGFEFRNYRRLTDEETFTIEGELINTTDAAWERVLVQVDIYAGTAYMTYCRTGVNNLEMNSSRHFRLQCRVTSGINLPDNISYKLLVAKAERD